MTRTRLEPSAWLLAAWSLLVIGDSLNRGDFSPAALGCLIAGFIVATVAILAGNELRQPGRGELALPVVACVVAAIAHPVAASMTIFGSQLFAIQAVAAAAAIVVAIGLWRPELQRAAWPLTIALTIATAVVVIAEQPKPIIDVWHILEQSSSGLLHGDDMYRQHWADSDGLQNVYPYLPWTTVLLAPVRWLTGDVRYELVGCLVVSALLIRRLAPKTPPALAALLLVTPHFAYYVLRSWTEPLLFVLLLLTFWAMQRGKSTVAVIALALALATKQPIALLWPLFAIWPQFGLRRAISSGVIAIVLVLPWIAAGPKDFWHDAVSANLGLGTLHRALSIPSALARHGVHIGFGLLAAGFILTYGLALLKIPRTTAGLALACAMVIWVYDLTNAQSFFNHYQLAAELLLASLALAPADRRGNGVVTDDPLVDSRGLDPISLGA